MKPRLAGFEPYKSKIFLSMGFTMPLDAVTRTFALLAVRGAGKSNTARVMAEEMFRNSLPFVAVDPVGCWWGLRSSADGKSPGLSIPVFGGRHSDIPLERGAGELLADLITEKRLSCVLDLSEFDSEGDKKYFLLAFAKRLLKKNTEPLHLFLEEADDYLPQKPMRDEAYLLRAWENIVRRGRFRGLGITLITQRSAVLNKNVLEMTENLFAMRTTGPRDRAAIQDWVKYHQVEGNVVSTLASLKDGETWVWSPNFLGKLERVQVRLAQTFDSGATPKYNRKSRAPATMADIDLGEIQARMASTIERAKAEDPKELRRKIAELERELCKPVAQVSPGRIMAEYKRGLQAGESKVAHSAWMLLQPLILKVEELQEATKVVKRALYDAEKQVEKPKQEVPRVRPHVRRSVESLVKDQIEKYGDISSAIGKGERKVLAAIAQHVGGVTREQLNVLTGYRRSSVNTYLQKLTGQSLAHRDGGRILATKEGFAALGSDFEPLPTGLKLQNYWMEKLPEGERKVLEVLLHRYPFAVLREVIEESTGYKRSSVNTYLQKLKARELVKAAGPGVVKASDTLF